jgi:hypothetical protein
MGIAKRGQRAQTRCTRAAMIEIYSIAKQLFDEYEDEIKELGINRPSNKIAIDYLLVCAAMNGQIKVGKLTPANNLYLKICKEV